MHIQTKLDLLTHATVTLVGSLVVYALYHSVQYVAVFIAGSIFIDLDHLIDYFLIYKWNFRFSVFVNHMYLDGGKIYLIWHSWEMVGLMLLAGALLHSHWILIFVVSLSIHLIIDNVQRRRRLFYFFIYRMVKRFDARYLLPEYFELRGKCKEGIR